MNVALHPAPAPSTRNILSLCAGVGGLELGILLALDALGEAGRGICYVEREAAAASSLVASMEAGWFHHAPVWSDMLTFDARPWRGVVHILASGDPCQDNSVAGKRAGADGDRFLAPQVCRLAEECRPDLIFRENVPGNADGQLGAIVPALERLGYRVAAGIFSSAETGNTMRRERLFIMAEHESVEGRLRSPAGRIADAGGRGSGMDGPGGGRYRDADEEIRSGRDGSVDAGGGLGCTPSPRSLPRAHPGICGSEESRRPRDAEPERRGGDMAGPIGHLEARRIAADGETRSGRPLGQSGGSGGTLEITGSGITQQPAGIGSGSGDPGGEGPSGEPSGSSLSLADPGYPRSQGQQRGQHSSQGREVKGGHAGFRSGAILHPPAVIPGPTDRRWADLLDRFPEYQPALSSEEAESHLRRGIDPLAHRIERLRATGNGVDPVVAAYAFLSLRALLAGERGAGAGVTVLTEAA